MTHSRIERTCRVVGCTNKPTLRQRTCRDCQLSGADWQRRMPGPGPHMRLRQDAFQARLQELACPNCGRGWPITQAEIARRVGVSRVHITVWFSGQSPIPPKHWPRLAEALQLTEAQFIATMLSGPASPDASVAEVEDSWAQR